MKTFLVKTLSILLISGEFPDLFEARSHPSFTLVNSIYWCLVTLFFLASDANLQIFYHHLVHQNMARVQTTRVPRLKLAALCLHTYRYSKL